MQSWTGSRHTWRPQGLVRARCSHGASPTRACATGPSTAKAARISCRCSTASWRSPTTCTTHDSWATRVSFSLPEAALCNLVSSLLNNGTAVYEMGPVSTAMERNLARWLAKQLGFPVGADGVFTSGGSAGNLTALLAARQAKAGFDVWTEGAHGGRPLAVLVSEQAHYCVSRSLQIMGFGKAGAWPVPVDARYRMRPEALPDAMHAAQASGRSVIAVVASAGSTATGAFDALEDVAEFCSVNDLWFHVDGAHGASAVLSDTHRGRLAGIERADSVVWDAHKMMLMPALVTAVLFRDGRHSYQPFAQEASYLFSRQAPEEQWFNLASRTLECTKTMMVLKLYAGLAVRGRRFFAEYLDSMFSLARRFSEAIRNAPDFELRGRTGLQHRVFPVDRSRPRERGSVRWQAGGSGHGRDPEPHPSSRARARAVLLGADDAACWRLPARHARQSGDEGLRSDKPA